MERVLITGDIHNHFAILNQLLNKKNVDTVICAGDFGYWPKFKHYEQLSDIKLQGTKRLLWCEGNHEDHWSLKERDSDEIEPGIIYMPRGSTYTLEDGRTILFMGGADSIDRQYRTLGKDWFPEEVITYKDLENLPDIKIDIIVSHTCPGELVQELQLFYPEKKLEPSNIALSILWERYNPDLWYFGHWHQYFDKKIKDTQFYGLSAPGYDFPGRWWVYLK